MKSTNRICKPGWVVALIWVCLLPLHKTYADAQPVIPYIDNTKVSWKPSGATAWLKTGFLEFENTITATDITADGKILFMGDDSGNLVALDTTSLQVLWKVPVIGSGDAIKVLKTDPAGNQILAAKQSGQNEYSHTYMVSNQGSSAQVTDMGIQDAFNPECSGTKMDPTNFRWSSDGNTFFILYETHALANRGGCMVAQEKYIFFNNLKTGNSGVTNIILDHFSKPEQDEPDSIWCMRPIRMEISPDGRTLATATCNSRIALWSVVGKKLKRKFLSKSILFQLRSQGYDPVGGTGFMHINRKNEIFFGMGEPGGMSKSSVVHLSANLKKMKLVAMFHLPYPRVHVSPNGKYLFAGSDTAFIFDLKLKQPVMWKNVGNAHGHMAQMHPKKKIIFLPDGKKITFLLERNRIEQRSTENWTSANLFIKPGDSLWLGGEDRARINAGFGEWLREDYKYGNSWLDQTATEVPEEQKNSANEFKIRASQGEADFTIYGGRTSSEKEDTDLLNAQPPW